MPTRRVFLQGGLASLPVLASGSAWLDALAAHALGQTTRNRSPRECRADVVVVGGGVGGFAAALAAARQGRSVILTEETDWLGGQLTQQGVPPDEHQWIEQICSTQSYRSFRTAVREYYRRHYPLTDAARANANLNPGDGSVSRLCHEPRVALAVLTDMLAPYVSARRVRVLLRHKAVSADVQGDRVRGVLVRSLESGSETLLTAPYFVDATELGDLLPLTGTEYVTGAESQKETGELHAPAEARPANMQAFTCCFAIDYIEGEDHTIDRPAEYDFWRDYVPRLAPPWPGKLLSWVMSHPRTLEPRPLEFDPAQAKGLWVYRRIASRRNFIDGTYRSDISLINWPQNDYWLGNLIDVPPEEAARNLARAKQLSLSLLYWMQTEAPRPDGGAGWKGIRLRPDILGTEDGLAKYPYIREARRIRAEFTVTEQHVGLDARMKRLGKPRAEITAEPFPDTVGTGSYNIDLHPTSGGDNYIDVSNLPFQIPLGALLPRRVQNLLPVCKNIGTTHITNGCYRLHPVEWVIGEAVGCLVHYCLAAKEIPRAVRNTAGRLAEFQALLQANGVDLRWPDTKQR